MPKTLDKMISSLEAQIAYIEALDRELISAYQQVEGDYLRHLIVARWYSNYILLREMQFNPTLVTTSLRRQEAELVRHAGILNGRVRDDPTWWWF